MSTRAESFAGWFRRRGHSFWTKLCTAETYDRCMTLLLGCSRGSSDCLVLPSDQLPGRQPSKAIAGERLRHPPTMPGREERRSDPKHRSCLR
jgi:hypothetical protein